MNCNRLSFVNYKILSRLPKKTPKSGILAACSKTGFKGFCSKKSHIDLSTSALRITKILREDRVEIGMRLVLYTMSPQERNQEARDRKDRNPQERKSRGLRREAHGSLKKIEANRKIPANRN